jgi:sortase A
MRRVLRALATALITAGVIVLADAAMTLAWKEPVSSIYGEIRQAHAAGQLENLERSFAGELGELGDGNEPEQARALAERLAKRMQTGEGIGRVKIPAIGLDTVLVEGTDTGTLRKGPGRYPETELPGQGGTIGIAGHRTTYLAPFRKIAELRSGGEVVIELPYGAFTYVVDRTRIVEPSDVQVVRDVGYEQLVLTACHPLYSAAQRYAVFARLREIELFA